MKVIREYSVEELVNGEWRSIGSTMSIEDARHDVDLLRRIGSRARMTCHRHVDWSTFIRIGVCSVIVAVLTFIMNAVPDLSDSRAEFNGCVLLFIVISAVALFYEIFGSEDDNE